MHPAINRIEKSVFDIIEITHNIEASPTSAMKASWKYKLN